MHDVTDIRVIEAVPTGDAESFIILYVSTEKGVLSYKLSLEQTGALLGDLYNATGSTAPGQSGDTVVSAAPEALRPRLA